jgi:hypothetical protein
MAADDPTNPLDAITLSQNPSPFPETGQDFLDKVRLQTSAILAQFIKVLPSNYVSRTTGPFYTLQFQAAAEQLAVFQVTAQEVFKDADYDYTRPEFLWEVLGSFVFPEATTVPTVDGDQAYRTFLKKMVLLLLRGATPGVMQEGAELLTEADVLLLERFLEAREPGSAFTIDDQFFVDLLVEEGGGTSFPAQPFVLQENVRLILKALKPAHVLYSYSHLFRETFGTLFVDTYSWEMSAYYYDDFRKFCYGAKEITGTAGVTLAGRTLFSDPTRSFDSVQVGGILTVLSGANAGAYRVAEVITFPLTIDATARAYTTSPTGLTGTATVSMGVITDSAQDFGAAVEGEVLTFTAGANAGSYRLDTLLGTNGGPVGVATGPATRVKVSPSMLRIETRMPSVLTGQSYSVGVDRLGVRVPKSVLGEDVSEQFYL